jgi:hypothetical protein
MKSGAQQMELVRRYFAGEATREETETLEHLLLEDPRLRRDFLAYARVDAGLPAAIRPRRQGHGQDHPSRRTRWISPVATAAAAVVMAWFAFQGSAPPSPAPELGTVTRLLHAEAADFSAHPTEGTRLRAGRLRLRRGAVQITLTNGVTLLFEGPGDLELISPMRAFLHSGQVVVRVPPAAIGFQVNAASVQVVDLGTEFAMKAGPGLDTDVQVFEGKIEASPAQGGFTRQLEAGHAVRYTGREDIPQNLAYAPARFLRRVPSEPGLPLPATLRNREFHPARHAEIVIPRAHSGMRVDGDLSDWTTKGLFFSERDAQRSVEGRMRYDAEGICLAAHIRDPHPMRSTVDPSVDGELGWKGGGLQVRLSLDRAQGWPADANHATYYSMRGLTATAEQIKRATNPRLISLTLWHHAPTGEACLHLAHGTDYSNGEVNPRGYAAVFRPDADDAGYCLEARIPWSVLRVEDDPPREGDTLAVCWNTHWSAPDGRTWFANLVEIRNPDEPQRIYDYERAATWGRAFYR